jgi:hypothetical protein
VVAAPFENPMTEPSTLYVNSQNYATVQAALDASKYVYIPAGVHATGTLTPQPGASIIGDGVDETVLDFGDHDGVCLYAPAHIDGLSIRGNRQANSIGVQMDKEHRQTCHWGRVKIAGMGRGLSLFNDGNGEQGFYDNDWGSVQISDCVNGVVIQATSAIINANIFRRLVITSCVNGLYIENALGLSIEFLRIESGVLGINVVKGGNINILHGWLEGLTKNILVADNPDVMGFRFWGSSDDLDAAYQYTTSDNRSDLLSFNAGGNYYRMAGRWWFDTLEATKTNAIIMRSPDGSRFGLDIDNMGNLIVSKL